MSNEPITWNPKEVWSFTDRKTFRVEVQHWVDDWKSSYGDRGPNHWNVYIYIYEGHPHFAGFNPDMDSGNAACNAYDFHGGATYFSPHYKPDKSIASYQIGCDYSHLHDDHFSHITTKDHARRVFLDAENLVRYMQSTKAEAMKVSP